MGFKSRRQDHHLLIFWFSLAQWLGLLAVIAAFVVTSYAYFGVGLKCVAFAAKLVDLLIVSTFLLLE